MIITGKHLPRRALLRGLGTAIALPWLDAMKPAMAASPAAKPGKTPVRLAFVYVPNGVDQRYWIPAETGKEFTLPRILASLKPYQNDLMVLSGLTHHNGLALGDGPGDHARAAATFLTGVHPKKTFGADIKVGISADQVAAAAIGDQTPFRSLELGLEDGRLVGNCDSGYSCAYSNSISWRGPATPMPPEINPRQVFERLFGVADRTESPAVRARRLRFEKSILDSVRVETARLEGRLGPTDRRKLDEYLVSIREIERRIQNAEANARELPDMDKPDGIPAEYAEHARLMFDLLTVAFQADLTRVATFMMAREGSNRTYREVGVPEAHHGLTHHRNNPEWMEKVAKINTYHIELFRHFVDKLAQAPDGDGRLLDHTLVVYGSGLGDGNRHTHHDLPVLLVGNGSGAFKAGRHVAYPKDTPMTNLFLALLDRAGVRPETLGDSTGRLEQLTDLG